MKHRAATASQSPHEILDKLSQLPGLIVITGTEPLLVMEAADVVRECARTHGFTDRQSFVMDARSDWQQVSMAAGAASLFGDKQLIEITLPSGKPGKPGAQAITKLINQYQTNAAQDAILVFKLPELDRQAQASDWYKALTNHSLVFNCATIARPALPRWIAARLAQQRQSVSNDVLDWMADHVEGNLLAAHQEILKLGLLYPEGLIEAEQVYSAVMNVARYDIMTLRDALIDGQANRALRILQGLQAEGQALPLVLWAVSEEIRTLAKALENTQTGQSLSEALRAQRVFGVREQKLITLQNHLGTKQLRNILKHAHDIDCLIKGIPVPGRLDDAWQELARLIVRIAGARTR